jgi:hypothetical protein
MRQKWIPERTGHHLTLRDAQCIHPDAENGVLNVQLPHGMVKLNHLSGNLKLGNLPHDAFNAYVLKDLHKWSLL